MTAHENQYSGKACVICGGKPKLYTVYGGYTVGCEFCGYGVLQSSVSRSRAFIKWDTLQTSLRERAKEGGVA